MSESANRNYPSVNNLRFNIGTIVSVGLGVFLFLLFFQPLELTNSDFNSRLIMQATFGAITLFFLGIFRIAIPLLFSKSFSPGKWNVKKEILIDFLFVSFNSVAFVFFAKYVGLVPISFHAVIIMVIISIVCVVVVRVRNQIYFLKNQLKISATTKQVNNHKKQAPKESEIIFNSENKSDFLRLHLHQLMLIKSANNYIEVIFKEGNEVKKKLIRSTLKNTEKLFASHSEIVRCHRSCMVNKNHIQKATKESDGLVLTIADYHEQVHVSRQYVLKVKEALKGS
jgi:DNA-binding LytR/AlgR family response regulator